MTVFLTGSYILCIGAFTFFQVRRLWGRQEQREAWAYAICMVLSCAIGALLIAGAELPSLVVPYQIVFESLGKKLLAP